MTWEAVRVILVSLAGFATIVSGLAWLLWKQLAPLDREKRGETRISRSDKRVLAMKESPWWAK
jgi:hypothetical protein